MLSLIFLFIFQDRCNETVNVRGIQTGGVDEVRSKMTIKLPHIRPEDHNKTVYCWVRFEGGVGQIVEVEVRQIRVGNYDETVKVSVKKMTLMLSFFCDR